MGQRSETMSDNLLYKNKKKNILDDSVIKNKKRKQNVDKTQK